MNGGRTFEFLNIFMPIVFLVPANLALGQPAWSVDVNLGYFTGDPSLAVDGKFGLPCMMSSSQPYAWWAVDLGDKYEITEVKISGFSEKDGRSRAHYRDVTMSTMAFKSLAAWLFVLQVIQAYS